jgi:hypothetical protein
VNEKGPVSVLWKLEEGVILVPWKWQGNSGKGSDLEEGPLLCKSLLLEKTGDTVVAYVLLMYDWHVFRSYQVCCLAREGLIL